jgi:hypothetical protein
LAGLSNERSQPESRFVLPGIPASVHGRGDRIEDGIVFVPGLIFNIVGTAWNLLVAFVAVNFARYNARICFPCGSIEHFGAMFMNVGFRLAVARGR